MDGQVKKGHDQDPLPGFGLAVIDESTVADGGDVAGSIVTGGVEGGVLAVSGSVSAGDTEVIDGTVIGGTSAVGKVVVSCWLVPARGAAVISVCGLGAASVFARGIGAAARQPSKVLL